VLTVSAPALAAVLRNPERAPQVTIFPPDFTPRAVAPMYRVAEHSGQQEGQDAAQLAAEIAERLRRLRTAYGEWPLFEPGPYFDLTAPQAASLVRVVERVATVHVIFFVDALLPSFRRLVDCCALAVQPALRSGALPPDVQSELVHRWQRLLAVLTIARTQVRDDVGFLAANGADDERTRWRTHWQRPPPEFLPPELLPELATIPTLTLGVDFPLPAFRQPGRLRRLRRTWERKRRNAGRALLGID
jgi:hypothetical protein